MVRTTQTDSRSLGRRAASILGVFGIFVLLLVTLPFWVVLLALYDLLRLRWRMPHVRLVAFALLWSGCEIIGVLASALLWVVGMRGNLRAHYALQRWWAGALMRSLRFTCGIKIEVSGLSELPAGPLLVLGRHASLADSLVSAWALGNLGGRRPRYVLKRELALDPCLDIVGHRLPNHFVDRQSADPESEVRSLVAMSADMKDGDAIVIFPEGTRTSASKRARMLEKLRARNPQRAERLESLRFLLPPKPAGATALLSALSDAHVVLCIHVGFDGLDTFGGILSALGRKLPIAHMRFISIDRPEGEDVVAWLDSLWLDADQMVGAMMEA